MPWPANHCSKGMCKEPLIWLLSYLCDRQIRLVRPFSSSHHSAFWTHSDAMQAVAIITLCSCTLAQAKVQATPTLSRTSTTTTFEPGSLQTFLLPLQTHTTWLSVNPLGQGVYHDTIPVRRSPSQLLGADAMAHPAPLLEGQSASDMSAASNEDCTSDKSSVKPCPGNHYKHPAATDLRSDLKDRWLRSCQGLTFMVGWLNYNRFFSYITQQVSKLKSKIPQIDQNQSI